MGAFGREVHNIWIPSRGRQEVRSNLVGLYLHTPRFRQATPSHACQRIDLFAHRL